MHFDLATIPQTEADELLISIVGPWAVGLDGKR